MKKLFITALTFVITALTVNGQGITKIVNDATNNSINVFRGGEYISLKKTEICSFIKDTGYVAINMSNNPSFSIQLSELTAPVCSNTTKLIDTLVKWTAVTSALTAVTQSGTWNITNVSGTVSLPTGASTGALQTSGNSSLTTIATLLGSSIAVTLPSGAMTLTSSVVTDDNTIAAGPRIISIYTSSDFAGNINGVARLSSTVYTFAAEVGKTLPAITYTTTTGSLTIDKLQ